MQFIKNNKLMLIALISCLSIATYMINGLVDWEGGMGIITAIVVVIATFSLPLVVIGVLALFKKTRNRQIYFSVLIAYSAYLFVSILTK